MEIKEVKKRTVILEEQLKIAIKDFYDSVSDDVILNIKYNIITQEVDDVKFVVRGDLEVGVSIY